MATGNFFAESPEKALGEGQEYLLRTFCGDAFSERVQFTRPLRGFCVSVRELNDALLWFTIEGAPGKIEVQVRLSAFTLPKSEVDACAAKWGSRLKQLFSN